MQGKTDFQRRNFHKLEAHFDTYPKVYKNLAFLRDCIPDLVDKKGKVR